MDDSKEENNVSQKEIRSLWLEHLNTPFPGRLMSDGDCLNLDQVLTKQIALAMENDCRVNPEISIILMAYCKGSDSMIEAVINRLNDEDEDYFIRLRDIARRLVSLEDKLSNNT